MKKKNLVALTGAGISAESGLKTFRDSDGLWMGYDVYEVASPQGWANNQDLVLDFYNMRRKDVASANPNSAHKALAELESDYEVTVITQNIDDLHERAGSSNVIHLHGEIFKMRSVSCPDTLDESHLFEIKGDIKSGDLAPDGGQLRPHVVWFGEAVPMIGVAAEYMQQADIFVLAGTSLQVYPAAGLIDFVPATSPKYIIDRNPPAVPAHYNFVVIKNNATDGLELLKEKLLSGL